MENNVGALIAEMAKNHIGKFVKFKKIMQITDLQYFIFQTFQFSNLQFPVHFQVSSKLVMPL